MEFLKNKGCLAEIIIIALLVIGIGIKFLSGNVKSQEMKNARTAGTVEAYQAIIDKHSGSKYAIEASDSLVSIYKRGNHSIQDLLAIRDVYKSKAGYYSLFNGINEIVESRINDLYNKAISTNTHAGWTQYCRDVPEEYWKDAKKRMVYLTPAYQRAANTNTIAGWQRYIASVSRDNIADAEERLGSLCREEYNKAKQANTVAAWRKFKQTVPKEYWQDADRQLENAQMEFYRNNQLSTGAKPWARYYGSGAGGNSWITVKASSSSDVVVVVKYNNSSGRVANHAYIRKGGRHTLSLPSGNRYQVFFYTGNGWYPDKEMKGEVKGGFLSGSWSKDGTPYVLGYGEEVTYTLTATVNGNFSTSGSSANEGL